MPPSRCRKTCRDGAAEGWRGGLGRVDREQVAAVVRVLDPAGRRLLVSKWRRANRGQVPVPAGAERGHGAGAGTAVGV